MCQKIAKVAILERCLRSRKRLSPEDDDPVAMQELIDWLVETIRPDGACFLDASFDSGSYTHSPLSSWHC